MVNKIMHGLRLNVEKALCEYEFLKNRSYPDFVYSRQAKDLRDEIPVFCFHSVTATDFEDKLDYLVSNGYRTLTADQLHGYLTGSLGTCSKAVALTFDDGWKSLWSTAYPLLKKYGLVGISFIVPTWIQDADDRSLNLEDFWAGRANFAAVTEPENVSRAHISWQEARIMSDAGVIDFQSHSLTHATVFTSERIVDFVHPQSSGYVYKIPIIAHTEKTGQALHRVFGMPLYTFAPRLAGARCFFDDQQLREACILYVTENGGSSFFSKRLWRKDLMDIFKKYRQDNKSKGRYETDEERDKAIICELSESKRMIEDALEKRVEHICYPFFSGSLLALEISKQYGYNSNYWGWQAPITSRAYRYGSDHLYQEIDMTDFNVGSVLKDRRTNRLGDDPYRIVRLPSDYIFRLPGEERKPVSKIIAQKCLRNLKNLSG